MLNVSRTSKKEDLWREVERLRQAADQEKNRTAVLKSQADTLREENSRLVERTRFMEELSERVRSANEKLEILTSLTKELASFDLDGVLEVAVQRIPYLVGARFASVYLYDRMEDQLILKHHTHGREIDRVVKLADAPTSLMAIAVQDKKTLCIDDLGDWKTRTGRPRRPHQERYETSSCVVAPLIAAGDVEGVLNLADRFDHRPFDHEDQLNLIQQACELLAVSLRNARLFEEVEQAARTCSLTGLLNHQAFIHQLDIEVKRAHRYENRLAVLTFRLHGLQLVNANFGHQKGDELIQGAARLLGRNVRDVDICGRTGGTEFGIMLPEQPLEGAMVVAERLSRLMAEGKHGVDASPYDVKATCGVAVYQRKGSGTELLRDALVALAKAREAGEPIGQGPVPGGG